MNQFKLQPVELTEANTKEHTQKSRNINEPL